MFWVEKREQVIPLSTRKRRNFHQNPITGAKRQVLLTDVLLQLDPKVSFNDGSWVKWNGMSE